MPDNRISSSPFRDITSETLTVPCPLCCNNFCLHWITATECRHFAFWRGNSVVIFLTYLIQLKNTSLNSIRLLFLAEYMGEQNSIHRNILKICKLYIYMYILPVNV